VESSQSGIVLFCLWINLLLWNLRAHHHVHIKPTLFPTLNKLHIHSFWTTFPCPISLLIYFNIVIPSVLFPWHFQQTFHLYCYHTYWIIDYIKVILYSFLFFLMLINTIERSIRIAKHYNIYFFFCCIFYLWYEYSTKNFVLKHSHSLRFQLVTLVEIHYYGMLDYNIWVMPGG